MKCDDVSFTKQFLLSLFDLIPVGCARFAYRKNFETSDKYLLLLYCTMSTLLSFCAELNAFRHGA